MMGIPEEDHQQIFHWTNIILGFGDPDLTTDMEEFMKVAWTWAPTPPRWPRAAGPNRATT